MANNFPTSLNDATSLVNNRTTGQTIPGSDHNDLANAQISVETKLGFGSSAPNTAGQVLTSLGGGQSSWQAPAGGGGGGGLVTFINVKTYGAVGNGSNDDTTAIQNAINAALATTLGLAAVYFPAGKYKITAKLNCSSATSTSAGKGVFLVGDGRNASSIVKNSAFIGVEWKGFAGPAGNPTAFGGIRNMTIDGNAQTGAAVHVTSGQQMEFFACSVIGNNDVALDLDTTQDSYFYDFTFNNCGSTSKYVIEMYGSADGTANMLWFHQLRIESFYKGALSVIRGSGATGGGNNGFFFSQCKFENYPTVHGSHICFFDSYTQQLVMDQIFLSVGQYDSGWSTPTNAITFGSASASPGFNQATFTNIFFNAAPTSLIGNSVININDSGGAMSGPVVINNVAAINQMNTAVLVINGASNLDVQIGQLGRNGGSLIAGDGTGQRLAAGTGTLSGGTATITTGRVRSTSRIFLTPTSKSANSGILTVGTIIGGTSFVVNSTNASDANTFNWWVVD